MIVLWCGPVSAANLASAKWSSRPDVVTVNKGAGGSVGSDAFAKLGAELRAANDGSVLRGLVPDGPVVVCGFSAAHGLIESILSSDEDLDRVVAVGAFDAYYTNAAKKPKPGYLRFAELAASSSRRMVLTSSHVAGPTYPSGADATAALLASLELAPIPLEDVPPARCDAGAGRGALRWYTYADRSELAKSHVQHATILAPHFAPELVGDTSSSGGGLGLLALGALAAWGLS